MCDESFICLLLASLANFAGLPTIELHHGRIDRVFAVARDLRAVRMLIQAFRLFGFRVG